MKGLPIRHRIYTCLQDNKLNDALKLCTKACKTNSQDAEMWLLLAGINSQLGNINQVIRCCRQAIALDADNISAYYNLGVALQANNRFEEASECYHRVLKLQPSHTLACTNLGLVSIELGQTPEAEASAERAIQRIHALINARNSLGLFELGQLLQKLNKYDEACSCYLSCIQFNAGFIQAHFELGYTRYLQEKYIAAAKSYNDVLEIEPNHIPTINNLGRVYERTGQYENAILQYQKVLALSSNKAMAYSNLGRIYLNLEIFEDAAEAYRNAVKEDPAHPEAHFGLGQAYCGLGDLAQAAFSFRKVLELDPDQRDAKYFLAFLEGEGPTSRATLDYSTGHFDDYAKKFENELVNVLEYRAPEILTDLLRKVTNNTSGFRVFDAGCGTGLCGPLLRDISIVLDGVDISPKMVEKAREKGVYDNLIVGELTKTLLDNKDSYDIVVSTDVFIYIGDLTEVFKAAYNSLKKGGLFGFSTETSTGTGFIIRPTGRFAHSAYYIKELAFDTGFILESSQDCALRKEYASVINGTVYLLRKA